MCATLSYFLLERCTKRKKVRVNKVDALFRPFSYTFNIIDDENIFHPNWWDPFYLFSSRGVFQQSKGFSLCKHLAIPQQSWTLIIIFSENFEIFNFFFPKTKFLWRKKSVIFHFQNRIIIRHWNVELGMVLWYAFVGMVLLVFYLP